METNTNKKAVTLAQVISAHQKSNKKIEAMTQKMEAMAAASPSSIEDAMYQTATRTQYSKAVDGEISMTDATVSSLLDDAALATLTAAGTDDEGNDQYNFLINGVQTGTYTKDSKLSAVLDDISSSEEAGVDARYDAETNSFVFTAKKYGADQDIRMGEGLADTMFGPPAGSDKSGECFAVVYNFVPLLNNPTRRETISAQVGSSSYSVTVTGETLIEDLTENLSSASGQQLTFYFDKYTGAIMARDGDGKLRDVVILNRMGGVMNPAEKPDSYTKGRDAVFTAINVNGKNATITDKTVNISVPTKTSQLENNSKFQTEEQVATAINAKVSSTYKAGGSVAFAALPTPDEAHLGFVYNVTDKFTTTDAFVEGAGSKNAAGTNVAIVAVTDGETTSYKYDVLAGFVDLSGYDTAEQSAAKLAGKVDKEEGKGLSSNDFTDAEKEKLAGITFATDEEVAAALAEIYGPDEA